MKIIVCAILAYLLTGVSQVIEDLGGRTIDRPMWAMRPTFAKAIFVVLAWPTRPIIERGSTALGRSIAFATLGVVIQLAVLTTFIFWAYTLAGFVFENFALQLILATAITFIGLMYLLPLVWVLATPIILAFARSLDSLFSTKNNRTPAVDDPPGPGVHEVSVWSGFTAWQKLIRSVVALAILALPFLAVFMLVKI